MPWQDEKLLYIVIAVLAAAVLFLILLHGSVRRKQRYRQETEREVSGRRRISPGMKQRILERDRYTCQICGISKDFVDELCPGLGDYLLLEIDHIESVADGGSGKDEDNLQVLCWRCNRKKGGFRTNEEVRDTIDYGIELLEDELYGDEAYDDESTEEETPRRRF
ncbi:MAG: HNH endonuclease [Lachnospiraceae bacterium]|nr:HNH endonuclease [Lachnospiraceae bacterium]